MITILIIAAALSVAVGLWLLNQKQVKDLEEVNTESHPWVDDLAPEVTPAPIAETIAKKKAVSKKKPATKKAPVKKAAKKKAKK